MPFQEYSREGWRAFQLRMPTEVMRVGGTLGEVEAIKLEKPSMNN